MSAAFAGAAPSGLHLAAALALQRTRACEILERAAGLLGSLVKEDGELERASKLAANVE